MFALMYVVYVMCCSLKVAFETEALRLSSWVNRVDESPLVLLATGLSSSLLLSARLLLLWTTVVAPPSKSCSSLHYYKHFTMTSWIFPFTASLPIFAKISPVHASQPQTLMLQTYTFSTLFVVLHSVLCTQYIQKWKPTSSSFNASLLGHLPG